MAVSGDTVVVGAYGEDSNATGVNGNQSDNSADGAGAAYVFVRSGTTWSQQAYLKASNTGASDHFGCVGGGLGRHGGGRGVRRRQQRHRGERQPERTTAPPMPGRPTSSCAAARTWSQQAYLKASNTGGK